MAILDKFKKLATEKVGTSGIGGEVDMMMKYASDRRKSFERRWYNNNFFDDGFHFRFVHRETGNIVDLSNNPNSGAPKRNIPKASRQIRGVANLLLAPNYVPVVYPDEVSVAQFEEYGEEKYEAFRMAQQLTAQVAQKQGQWLTEEWKRQELTDKLIHMVILAAKHGVAYIQITPDSIRETLDAGVFDAFDIYVVGDVTDIYNAAAIIKAHPRAIKEIKADEMFEDADLEKLSPDNKLASSEVKEAYKRSKVGGVTGDSNPTIIQKEAFIKEFLNKDNIEAIASKYPYVVEGKKIGDMCMRHVFTAGGVTLLDEYVALTEYPFVDFRFEPGDLYQTPFIERFMGANKSIDLIVHRMEQWANTMAVGSWSVRSGEEFNITNKAGGSIYEYEVTPPTQNQIAPLPNTLFNLVGMLEQFIEEQGASTSALGKLPSGVKSGVAIESLKATEYDNLTIPASMLKKAVKRISERMLDYVADYYLNPQTISMSDNGKPSYLDIIGERGAKLHSELDNQVSPDTVIVKKGLKVNVEVESGLGFTMQGRKEAAQQIIDYMLRLAEMGLVPMEAVNEVTQQFLRTFQFGSTSEIMQSIEQFTAQKNAEGDPGQMTPQDQKQIELVKVAVLEALEAAGEIGEAGQQAMVDAAKVGLLEVMQEMQGGGEQPPMQEEIPMDQMMQ
jgi:hypothetical protein